MHKHHTPRISQIMIQIEIIAVLGGSFQVGKRIVDGERRITHAERVAHVGEMSLRKNEGMGDSLARRGFYETNEMRKVDGKTKDGFGTSRWPPPMG
mmetsp:Transcript_36590/g.76161  ORF Transcript_36590/g.76161 Transcript_36590/m.76161 type:complete len:96 (+) Transcript_36590:1387-1674(+)